MSNTALRRFDLAAWRTTACRSFGKLDVAAATAPAQPFWAELLSTAVGDISLFDMHTAAHSVSRPASYISTADTGFCKLSLQLDGTSSLTQDGRTCHLLPGDLALYVTQRSYTLDYPGQQRSLVVHFPERLLNMSPSQVKSITARPISRNHGLGKVAVPLFEQLAKNIDVLRGPHATALVHSALNVLVSVLSSELQAQDPFPKNLLFTQAQGYITQHLGNDELSPHTIAAALFVSVRHLHARFAAEGLSVSTYIRTRRLECIRTELADPLHAQESIAIISSRYGLHDPSHFSRIFKAEYKESPSAYRSRILHG